MGNKKLLTEEINKMLHLMNHRLGTPRLNEEIEIEFGFPLRSKTPNQKRRTTKTTSEKPFFPGDHWKEIPFTKEVSVPKYLYHRTSTSNRGQILNQGLIPKIGNVTLAGFGFSPENFEESALKYLENYGDYHIKYGKNIRDYLPQPYGNVRPMVFASTELNDHYIPPGTRENYDIWRIDTEGLNNKWFRDTFYLGTSSEGYPISVVTDTIIPKKNLTLV